MQRHTLLLEVFRVNWWMAHYGGSSPKRHLGLTNNAWCQKFNLGKLTKKQRLSCKAKPTKRTVNKTTGKVGYQGTSELKQTQSLAIIVKIVPRIMHLNYIAL